MSSLSIDTVNKCVLFTYSWLCWSLLPVPLFAFCLLLTAVASLVLERGLQGTRASVAEVVASLVLERGLQGTRASAAEALWLSCSVVYRIILDPGPSPCPCIGWTTGPQGSPH